MRFIAMAVLCGFMAPQLIALVLPKEVPGVVRRFMIALAFASLVEHNGDEPLCLAILAVWVATEIFDVLSSGYDRMHAAALCDEPVTHCVCSEDGRDGFLGCYRHAVVARANCRAFAQRPIEYFDRVSHGCDWFTCQHEPSMEDMSKAMYRKVFRKEAV